MRSNVDEKRSYLNEVRKHLDEIKKLLGSHVVDTRNDVGDDMCL